VTRCSPGTAFVLLAALLLPGRAEGSLFPTGIRNSGFQSGDLRGFRGDGLGYATVGVVQQGTALSFEPESVEIPFPNGPGSFAVRLRGTGLPGSVGILTSVPFVPGSADLTFDMLSESAQVRLELLFLDPAADILEPGAVVQRRIVLPVERPAPGADARFVTMRVPFPGGAARPVKVQFRQETLEPGRGWYTLVTNVRAAPAARPDDRDGDDVPDAIDDCPTVPNPDQENSDGDRVGDVCDDCLYVKNDDQADRNGDGIGDRCAIDIDGDGFTDETDLALMADALGGAYDARCDFNDDGRVDLADLALFAESIQIGLDSDDLQDFTFGFVDHSLRGGFALVVRRGTVISGNPGSDLVRFPGLMSLLVRSDRPGNPDSVGVVTSRPFVPRGPRLTVATLSESSQVASRLLVLRETRSPRSPAPADVLVDVPLRNERPGTGAGVEFETQVIDVSPWFNAARPLHGPRLQLQLRQHTTSPGNGFFTLIGDVRTSP
jgi:hypothetical protein